MVVWSAEKWVGLMVEMMVVLTADLSVKMMVDWMVDD
jgi:hypothetical protein